MNKTLNKPQYSKINWTALATLGASLLVVFNVIPEEHEAVFAESVLVLSPIMTMIFRTWFTGNKVEA